MGNGYIGCIWANVMITVTDMVMERYGIIGMISGELNLLTSNLLGK